MTAMLLSLLLAGAPALAQDDGSSSVAPAATPPPTAAPTDDELAERAKQGELGAFNALVGRYQRPVFGLCLRMLQEASRAEELTQEIFVLAWQKLDSFRGASAFSTTAWSRRW